VAASFDAGGFDGHRYIAVLALEDAVDVSRLEIRYVDGPGALRLFHVSLVGADGTTIPLTLMDAARADDARWSICALPGPHEIFRNRRALPRAWFVLETVALDDAAALHAVESGRLPSGAAFDAKRTALVEQGAADALSRAGGGQARIRAPATAREDDDTAEVSQDTRETGKADIIAYTPNRVTVAYESTLPAFLVLADSFYPGWNAYIDGSATPTVLWRADYGLRGAVVPAGRHDVHFVYEPRSVTLGCALTALGVLLLTAGGYVACRRDVRAGSR
jgi:hypothetical protein